MQVIKIKHFYALLMPFKDPEFMSANFPAQLAAAQLLSRVAFYLASSHSDHNAV
jgi:hypothetical protein